LITLGGLRPNALFDGHRRGSMSILAFGADFLARRGTDYRAACQAMIPFDAVDHLRLAGLGVQVAHGQTKHRGAEGYAESF
jgi:hypothetical protein